MHDRLFVGHPQKHRFSVAVLEAEKFAADRLVTPGFLPQFRGQDDRHLDLLAVDAVHFLADDRLDFFENPHPDRENGIDSGGNRTDIAAADQKFMADGFRVLRILFDPSAEHL